MIFYWMIISIISFSLFAIDKKFAQQNKWRISENALLASAIVGGSVGALLGMFTFHHKTKKMKFMIGIPIILVIQIILYNLLIS